VRDSVQRYNDLNVTAIAAVTFVGAVLTFAAILGIQVLYYAVANRQHEQKVVDAPTFESDSVIAEQEVKLTRYGWINREKEQVAVPIDRAMELVVRELSSENGKEQSDGS